MTAPNKVIAAGVQLTHLGFVDGSGVLVGSDITAPANGANSTMMDVIGIQEMPTGIQEGESVPVEGDDTVLGQIDFAANTLPTFVVTLGVQDLDLDAKLQGTKVKTEGDVRFGVLQPNNPNYPDACLIVQSKSKSQDTGTSGTKAWSGQLIPLLSVQPLGRETFAGRTAGNNRLRVTTQVATRTPWGVTMNETDYGTTGAPVMPFTGDNPVIMHRFTGNGSTDTLLLAKTPVSQSKIKVHNNTAPLTPGVDFTLTGSTITFTSPPAAAAKVIVLYEYTV